VNILITGAASGIGRLLAEHLFLKEHANLLLADMNVEGLNTLEAELTSRKSDGNIRLFEVDISSETSVRSLLEELSGSSIDILINNAGIVGVGTFQNTPINDLQRIIDVNLMGTMRFTHAMLPLVLRSEKPSIITITSAAGYVAAPGLSAYSASKFGLRGFMDALRAELKGKAQVCTIAPAFVKTDLAKHATNKESDPAKQKMDQFLQNMGDDPSTVVWAVVKAIKNNRKRVLVNGQAYFLYYMSRYAPWLRDVLIGIMYRKLKKDGVISE
jgi:short-subunit dehydrogenase